MLLCVLSVCTLSCYAQEDVNEEEIIKRVISLDLGLNGQFPVGRYKTEGGALEKGISFSSLIQMKPKSSAFVGLELSHHWLQSLDTDLLEDINGIQVEVNETYQTHSIDAMLSSRIFPNISLGPIEPFGEMGVGLKFFYSSIRQVSIDETDISSFSAENGDAALQFGLGFGFLSELSDQLFLNAKFRYLRTGTLNYQVIDPDRSFSFPEDGFRDVLSTMSTLGFYIGINWLL